MVQYVLESERAFQKQTAMIDMAIQEELADELAPITRSMKALLLDGTYQWVRVSTPRIRLGFTVPSQFTRSISFCVVPHSVEFRRELRLQAAARLFELSFSPRHAS